MNEMQKMQTKTNEVIEKITNVESDEEASEQFKGLIKMIKSEKNYKQLCKNKQNYFALK